MDCADVVLSRSHVHAPKEWSIPQRHPPAGRGSLTVTAMRSCTCCNGSDISHGRSLLNESSTSARSGLLGRVRTTSLARSCCPQHRPAGIRATFACPMHSSLSEFFGHLVCGSGALLWVQVGHGFCDALLDTAPRLCSFSDVVWNGTYLHALIEFAFTTPTRYRVQQQLLLTDTQSSVLVTNVWSLHSPLTACSGSVAPVL
eukprot:NODE_2289_length_1095_cov_38.592975_g2271_i0.p1 GENE.NODE_2289_length_1095_cov_38.592975_g2271_i0~~NODE_2289_length_1095_cov_38.592975_g2271_i0.p1  ORF type:complete len:201 (+),score=1.99 NODE_2289_length_1095_cov_38.592975_g2271_i0:246-848(+)